MVEFETSAPVRFATVRVNPAGRRSGRFTTGAGRLGRSEKSEAMPKVTLSVILKKHPNLKKHELNLAARRGELTAHANPKRKRHNLYDTAQVARWIDRRGMPRPQSDYPTFEENFGKHRCKWRAQKSAYGTYGFSNTAIHRLTRTGQLAKRDERIKGRRAPVRFLLEDTDDGKRQDTLSVQFGPRTTPVPPSRNIRTPGELRAAPDDDGATRAELDAFGLPYHLVYKYSGTSKWRGRSLGAFNPPRPIREGLPRICFIGKGRHTLPTWRIGDLRRVREWLDKEQDMIPVPVKGLGGFSYWGLIDLIEAGTVRGGRFPYRSNDDRMLKDKWLIDPASLKNAVTRKTKVGRRRIQWIIENGKLVDYWPQSETLRLISYGTADAKEKKSPLVNGLELIEWTPKQFRNGRGGHDCPHLGRPYRCVAATTPDGADLLHYSGNDSRTIEQKLKGWDHPRAAPTPPPMPSGARKRGGRPRLGGAAEHVRLQTLERWRCAKDVGTKQKEFCLDQGITPATLKRYQIWQNGKKTPPHAREIL